jgi:5-methylcytosine-specific restriction endonuclease McrA
MTRALGYGASGAYASSSCHYCGKPATTDDHIVPRSAFRMHQSALPYWFRQHNIAPACLPCNGFKDWYRSDCTCQQCQWVWTVALAHKEVWLKPTYEVMIRRVIKVGMSRR